MWIIWYICINILHTVMLGSCQLIESQNPQDDKIET
jgi:hypothetical protein